MEVDNGVAGAAVVPLVQSPGHQAMSEMSGWRGHGWLGQPCADGKPVFRTALGFGVQRDGASEYRTREERESAPFRDKLDVAMPQRRGARIPSLSNIWARL